MKRMRMLLALGLATAGAAGLAACTHEQPSLALNPQYRLAYDDKGQTVALAYGRPNSDELALMLECPKGSGKVELSDTIRDKRAAAIVLSSDGKKTSVPVRSEASEVDGEAILTGRLPLSAPALQGLRRTGVLQVSSGQARYTVAVGAGGRVGVERFFKACG